MRTKTQEKEAEISEWWSKMHRELAEIITAEFPSGTKVKWLTGKHWQHGVVEESSLFDIPTGLKVRNSKTKSVIRKDAKDFFPDTD